MHCEPCQLVAASGYFISRDGGLDHLADGAGKGGAAAPGPGQVWLGRFGTLTACCPDRSVSVSHRIRHRLRRWVKPFWPQDRFKSIEGPWVISPVPGPRASSSDMAVPTPSNGFIRMTTPSPGAVLLKRSGARAA